MSKAEDVEEIDANAFAAELLMPRDFLLRDARKLTLDKEAEEQVSSLAFHDFVRFSRWDAGAV